VFSIRKFSSLIMIAISVLIVVSLTVDSSTFALYAKNKKKKGKKGQAEEIDKAAAQKKYMFELRKSWSFGYENYKNKQFDRSLKHFWKVTELDTMGMFQKVYRYLGDCYFKLEQADSAQIVFELGAKKYPDDAHLHRMTGFLNVQRELLDEAIGSYEKVVEIEKANDDSDEWKQLIADMMQLLKLYIRVDRADDALAVVDEILAKDSENQEAIDIKIQLLKSGGDIDAVIENMERTRELQPEDSRVRFDLAKIYFDNEKYGKSLEIFTEFLTLVPNDQEAIKYIAKSYRNLGKVSQSITEFKKVLALDPSNKEVICEIGRAYIELGKYASARVYGKKALAIDKGFGLGYIVIGEAYEVAAEKCVEGKKVEFNDKLAYELAAKEYQKAKKDLAYTQDSKRHLDYLQVLLPTNEDRFMNKGKKKPSGSCYDWIYK